MKTKLLLLGLLFSQVVLAAGGIKGYIRDTNGEPLAYATIYVEEAGSGTVTNEEGYYEFRLLPGDYRVIFQHLGYETQVQRISVGENMKEINVRLAPQTFELEAVEIIDGGENPAYTVMRKAIAKADYHRQQVDYYKAQVYIKGSGRVLGTPRLLRKVLEEEGIKPDSNMAYTSESVSIIEYERPNTFRERVISVYSEGDSNDSSPMAYINGSFYNAEIAQVISPLSPRAFGYYRFELAGFFQDRGYYVNKIKVTPRSRGDNVFEGHIYIVEDLWSIHSLNLATYKLGIKFDIEQIYAPIQEDVWLPVSHRFIVTGKVFGFGFDYKYLATVSDYEVRVNPDLDVDFSVIDEKIDRELAAEARARMEAQDKRSEIEDKLEGGQELTRKDLRRLMREYEKEEAAEDPEPEVVSNYSYQVDSLANRRDSSYWAVIRPVPLTKAEVRGYEVSDSLTIAAKEEAEAAEDGVKKSERGDGKGFQFFDLISGYSHKIGEGKYFHYDGLHNGGFNPVEGYWMASRFRYTSRNEDRRFRVSLTPRYGFAWDRLVWLGSTDYRSGPDNYRSNIRLRGGRYVAQFNEPRPVIEVFNTLYALIGERNFVRLYEKEFLQLRYQKDWFKTASLELSAEWADRRFLQNTTDYTLFDRDDRAYAPNRPDILEAPSLEPLQGRERAAIVRADLGWSPWQKYSVRNNKKSAINGSSPRFNLHYQGGLPDVAESVTDYHRLGLTYRHTIRPGARGRIDLKVDMGLFLSDNYVGLADYRHFDGNQMFFTTADPVGAFRLLPYYTFSTADRWVAAHAHYQFRKFLFTQIWEVQMTGARENLFVNYLNTPTSEHYTEVGYGIDNILRFLRVETIVAFRDGSYYDWGIRIGVASNILGGFGTVSIDTDD